MSQVMKSDDESANVKMAENIQKNKFLTVKDNEDLKKQVKVKKTLNDTFWSEFNDGVKDKHYKTFMKNAEKAGVRSKREQERTNISALDHSNDSVENQMNL